MSASEYRVARAQADAAKARLMRSVEAAKFRLSPATISSNVVEDVRDRTIAAAEAAGDAARRRPGVAAGAGVAAVLLLARRPIASLFRRRKPNLEHEPVAGRNKELNHDRH